MRCSRLDAAQRAARLQRTRDRLRHQCRDVATVLPQLTAIPLRIDKKGPGDGTLFVQQLNFRDRCLRPNFKRHALFDVQPACSNFVEVGCVRSVRHG